MLQQQRYILHGNLSEKVPNSRITETQIGPDSENSEIFKYNIQYTVKTNI